MLPGGPINSREGRKAYAMMAQCLNEFKKACCLGGFPGNTLWHSFKHLIYQTKIRNLERIQ